jgi:hypothetical protein
MDLSVKFYHIRFRQTSRALAPECFARYRFAA